MCGVFFILILHLILVSFIYRNVLENDMDIDEARGTLRQVSEALSWTLTDVLARFPLGGYEAAQIEPYMERWGSRSLHEFLVHIVRMTGNRPDLTGSHGPTNIFLVLADIYGY